MGKGIKDPNDKLRCLKVLDVTALLDPLEASTRSLKDSSDVDVFRESLGSILQVYGSDLLKLTEAVRFKTCLSTSQKLTDRLFSQSDTPDDVRLEADVMLTNALPLVLRFLSDRCNETATSVFAFLGDYLRASRKYIRPIQPVVVNGKGSNSMPPPPTPYIPLPSEKRLFLSSLLEIIVRRMEWGDDLDWEISGDAGDSEDEVNIFLLLRTNLRGFIDQIAQIDKELYVEVIAAIVLSTLETLGSRGPGAVSWQQAELAVHLVYIFGEILRSELELLEHKD